MPSLQKPVIRAGKRLPFMLMFFVACKALRGLAVDQAPQRVPMVPHGCQKSGLVLLGAPGLGGKESPAVQGADEEVLSALKGRNKRSDILKFPAVDLKQLNADGDLSFDKRRGKLAQVVAMP
ncbi:hypothetical protein VTI74DRAFT_10434 [Chaetomium olivicolor]